MNFEHILFSIEAGVALLSLNRPDQLNSFNTQMHGEEAKRSSKCGRTRTCACCC
jgi:enoyl-CoA hydratase/carnithine racemase